MIKIYLNFKIVLNTKKIKKGKIYLYTHSTNAFHLMLEKGLRFPSRSP